MKKENIRINLKYVTNFNPNFLIKTFNIDKKSKNPNNKINCKNFIIFVLLLKNIFKKNKISIFIKPKYSNLTNILRAPYKNKMSRHQIALSRFFFNISLKFDIDTAVKLHNLGNVNFFLAKLLNFYSFFESNVCFQHKSTIIFNFYLKNFFLLK